MYFFVYRYIKFHFDGDLALTSMFHKRDGQILKQDVLIKRAIGRKRFTSKFNFKERFFILTEKTLSYFEGSEEVYLHFYVFFVYFIYYIFEKL